MKWASYLVDVIEILSALFFGYFTPYVTDRIIRYYSIKSPPVFFQAVSVIVIMVLVMVLHFAVYNRMRAFISKKYNQGS